MSDLFSLLHALLIGMQLSLVRLILCPQLECTLFQRAQVIFHLSQLLAQQSRMGGSGQSCSGRGGVQVRPGGVDCAGTDGCETCGSVALTQALLV